MAWILFTYWLTQLSLAKTPLQNNLGTIFKRFNGKVNNSVYSLNPGLPAATPTKTWGLSFFNYLQLKLCNTHAASLKAHQNFHTANPLPQLSYCNCPEAILNLQFYICNSNSAILRLHEKSIEQRQAVAKPC